MSTKQCINQLEELEEKESSFGRVFKVDGPLVVAEKMAEAKMYELVKVGWDKLVGEIIKLEGDNASIQCYEDTSGLKVGDPIMNTKSPLQVELGPGILTQIYDGIQRPLKMITDQTEQSIFVPRGVGVAALDQDRVWEFIPSTNIKIGNLISGGDIYGSVFENNLFEQHKILTAPNVQGRVTYIAPQGNYTLQDKVLEVELDGQKQQYGMSHFWPIRQPRPIIEKLQSNTPLLTGFRVFDTLYPSVLGGTCCIPGSLGCGKSSISQALAKCSNTECIIYVGCCEEGNETFVLSIFPELTIQMKGKEENIMQRTCLVANTSDMPLAAREASINTGITLAEYFRDMGLNVSMMADSTSKWIEASYRLAEIPADQGYIASKLAQFYDRAGRVRCRGSPDREGSITIVGAVTPPGGDFTDPISTATLQIAQVYWGLDMKLAQRKHFPSVNWTNSTSNYEKILDPYFNNLDPEFTHLRNIIKEILHEEIELNQMVQLKGIDSLSEVQKLSLQIAKNIREDFLQQNSFSQFDYYCPLEKTIGMMKCFVTYFECAKKAILESDAKITCNIIINNTKPLFFPLLQMKFQNPKQSKQELQNHFNQFADIIKQSFIKLTGK